MSVEAAFWFPGCGVEVADINFHLFTHLFYGFAGVDPKCSIVTIPDKDMVAFATFNNKVSEKNQTVKTVLSIGGSDYPTNVFADMADKPDRRAAFISSSISLARSYGFDGLELHWKYPDTQHDMTNFTTLLKEWHIQLVCDATLRKMDRLYLTAAVYHSPTYKPNVVYNVKAIRDHLDWINLISYDFVSPSRSNSTHPPANLCTTAQTNVNSAIGAWTGPGMPGDKILVGLSCFGYKWHLKEDGKNDIFAPSYEMGKDYMLSYRDIRAVTEGQGAFARAVYDKESMTNYVHQGCTWVGYDDAHSIAKKVEEAKKRGLLGYFVWHVGGDANWILSREASRTWGRIVPRPKL